MDFLTIAIIGYFLLSAESVLSKALLTGRLKSWQLYVFYVGIFSAFSFLLFPLNLIWPGWDVFAISFTSGLFFMAGLAFLFSALYKSTASRVYVLFGSIVTITTFLASDVFSPHSVTIRELEGLGLLLLGGFFIAFKFYKRKLFSSWSKILAAGILSGVAFVVLKYAFDEQNFISGYIYSRAGMVFATLVLLAWPAFRREIFGRLGKDRRKNTGDFFSVIGVKALAGTGTFIVTYAVSLGSVTIVNALVSVQYLFTFIFSVILSIYFKKIFQEEIFASNLFFKFIGVGLVIGGVLLVSM